MNCIISGQDPRSVRTGATALPVPAHDQGELRGRWGRGCGRPTPEGMAQADRHINPQSERKARARQLLWDTSSSTTGSGDQVPRYPVLEEPLPPGLDTLDGYGKRIGYRGRYLYYFWRPREGFPGPVAEVPARGSHGGRNELVYDVKRLDAFRATQADLWGRRKMPRVTTAQDLDLRITAAEFAALAGADPAALRPYQALRGFPEPDEDGRRRLGDLVAYWNTRPIVLLEHDRDQRMPLGQIADRVLQVARKTVTQYRDAPGFPEPDEDGRYRLGDVVDFLNDRPGKRGAASRPAAQP
jgi:hypothetical protein